MEMVFRKDQSFFSNPSINLGNRKYFLEKLYLNLWETIVSAFHAISPEVVFHILSLMSFLPRNFKKSNEAKSSQ